MPGTEFIEVLTMAEREKKLHAYRQKRHFERTPEPAGKDKSPFAAGPIFVVQKHDASNLHYDFRIEVDGVLKSWAAPKGPTLDPHIRHLAMPTEDHPMEYAAFEGIIPRGEYGGGTVMVWDFGLYENLTEKGDETMPMVEAIERGHVVMQLHGKKLRGNFALIRTGSQKGRPRWLLIKMNDEEARPDSDITATEPNSALTGRSLEQIAAEQDDTWRSAA